MYLWGPTFYLPKIQTQKNENLQRNLNVHFCVRIILGCFSKPEKLWGKMSPLLPRHCDVYTG